MGDASEEWQAVRDVSVGDVVGSYDPVTGQWMCGRYDATHAGGVQPTVKTDHADHAIAQQWSMPMQQHHHQWEKGDVPTCSVPALCYYPRASGRGRECDVRVRVRESID